MASEPEYSLYIGAANLIAALSIQRIDTREAALHVADVVRIVGTVQHIVRPAHRQALGERFLLINDRIQVDLLEVTAWFTRDLFAAGRHVVVALIEPADDIRQGPAAVRRDQLQVGVAIEKAVEDHPSNC